MTTCDFLERHFTLGSAASELPAHLAECGSCRAQSEALIRLDALYARLARPAVPEALKARWRSIPAQTLDCDTACELLARSMEEPLGARLSSRLEFHIHRCESCRETREVLGVLPELRVPPAPTPLYRPAPTPVVSLDAERERRRGRLLNWSDPRLYAAAACILAGFLAIFANSVETASGGRAEPLARSVVETFRVRFTETAERFTKWQDGVSRKVVATRETLFGYTRAAGAIALSAAGHATEGLFQKENKTEKGNKS
jgi:hypothetical protein